MSAEKSPIDRVLTIDIPNVSDGRGYIAILEAEKQVPFGIKRIFYISDVPDGAVRANHANKTDQLFVPLNGGVTLNLNDGRKKTEVRLEQRHHGLYVPGMIWKIGTRTGRSR